MNDVAKSDQVVATAEIYLPQVAFQIVVAVADPELGRVFARDLGDWREIEHRDMHAADRLGKWDRPGRCAAAYIQYPLDSRAPRRTDRRDRRFGTNEAERKDAPDQNREEGCSPSLVARRHDRPSRFHGLRQLEPAHHLAFGKLVDSFHVEFAPANQEGRRLRT